MKLFYKLSLRNPTSDLIQIDYSSKKWQWSHNLTHNVILNFCETVLFLLSILVTRPSFMSISSLVLELWRFSFTRDCPEIQKVKTPQSGFWPISEDWNEYEIPHVARMSLSKWYWMLESSGVLPLKLPLHPD